MSNDINILWFRKDLRLMDNPALVEANLNAEIIPIFILDDTNPEENRMGAASRVWLYHSLKSLNISLQKKINFYSGDPVKIISELINNYNINGVYWNRCYEPWEIRRDKKIKDLLKIKKVKAKSFNGSLIREPWEVLKEDQTPYKVFTALYKKAYLNSDIKVEVINEPTKINYSTKIFSSNTLDTLKLLPNLSWADNIIKYWQVGEKNAHLKMTEFFKKGIDDYKEGRNFPFKKNVSRLSPHIHFGEISPKQLWVKAKSISSNKNTEHFVSEICWREFSYYLLYHFPNLPKDNLQKKFNNFPWKNNNYYFDSWKKGKTGYPIIDAGMRELYETGYMHNRVRMIVASFLVKNLLIHWHKGERWFWDCLFDADLANNSASWQWVAGSGADAAPYFRIFNPVTQGVKFDVDGQYTKQYVPELKDMPNKYLFSPWEAPDDVLNKANVVLGGNYPKPIIDIKESREKALYSFSLIK
ncbi:DNA photolyase family protein [Alphaproteobacteria bacterium]|nr:DNA photolyase family protein [Alphaproteobacteria bacterium]